jgi:hypothetical protein
MALASSAFLIVTSLVGMLAEASDCNHRVFKGDLPDMSELVRWFEQATQEDVRWAEFNLKLGYQGISRKQWAGAAKAFAGAIMCRPTPRALLNRAFTYANTRDSGSCEDEVDARIQIVRRALDYFDAGLEMHKILGSKSDLDDAAIVDFHKKMLDAQERLLDFQRKCFDPKKSLSSGK